jgi:hypothetical protein
MSVLDRVTSTGYLDELDARSLSELRGMRAECQDIENALSYVRRLVHGRIDIVAAEAARRREGADSGTLAAIIERLPEVFAERRHPDVNPRPPQELAPVELADQLVLELDGAPTDGGLATLPDLSDDELAAFGQRLSEQERWLSVHRRQLHEIIDRLHGEIIRRYESGEATVESLLS